MHFVFPQNYNFHSKLFGVFNYTSLVFDAFLAIFLFAFSNLLFEELEIKILFFIGLYLPIFLLSFIGVHNESIFSVFLVLYQFIKNRHIYFYSKST